MTRAKPAASTETGQEVDTVIEEGTEVAQEIAEEAAQIEPEVEGTPVPEDDATNGDTMEADLNEADATVKALWTALIDAKLEVGRIALEVSPETDADPITTLKSMAKLLKTTPNTLLKYRKMVLDAIAKQAKRAA